MISISVITTLHIPIATAVAAVLPHGWLEFAAIRSLSWIRVFCLPRCRQSKIGDNVGFEVRRFEHDPDGQLGTSP